MSILVYPFSKSNYILKIGFLTDIFHWIYCIVSELWCWQWAILHFISIDHLAISHFVSTDNRAISHFVSIALLGKWYVITVGPPQKRFWLFYSYFGRNSPYYKKNTFLLCLCRMFAISSMAAAVSGFSFWWHSKQMSAPPPLPQQHGALAWSELVPIIAHVCVYLWCDKVCTLRQCLPGSTLLRSLANIWPPGHY